MIFSTSESGPIRFGAKEIVFGSGKIKPPGNRQERTPYRNYSRRRFRFFGTQSHAKIAVTDFCNPNVSSMLSVPVPSRDKPNSNPDQVKRVGTRHQIWLTASLATLIVLSPLLQLPGLPRLMMFLVATSVIISAVYAVSWNSARLAVGLMLALPAVISFWSDWLRETPMLAVVTLITRIIFFIYTLITILQFVFRSRRITTNELFGAINVYILVGITFGFLFALIDLIHPGSFRTPDGDRSYEVLVYYSFSTLATLGIGDVVPVSALARSLSILELIIGVLYIAVLIGQLVGHRRFGSGITVDRITSNTSASYLVGRKTPVPRHFCIICALFTAALNYATSVLTVSVNMPFYLDSWATSLGTIVGGLRVGLVGGVLYNIVMAFTFWGTTAVIWSLSSALISVLTWLFWHKGWINIHRPGKLAVAGFCLGTINSCLVFVVQSFIGRDALLNTAALRQDLQSLISNSTVVTFLEQWIVEIMDKTVSLAMAAIALFVLGEIVRKRDRNKVSQSG